MRTGVNVGNWADFLMNCIQNIIISINWNKFRFHAEAEAFNSTKAYLLLKIPKISACMYVCINLWLHYFKNCIDSPLIFEQKLLDTHFILLRLTHPTPGIGTGSRIDVCDHSMCSVSAPLDTHIQILLITICVIKNSKRYLICFWL